MVAISIIVLIICLFLALFVLAQNPKGGGLAAGFTGAQQIGGVQRTADFLEKGTWTLAAALMVLCLFSASIQKGGAGTATLQTSTELPSAGATEGAIAPEMPSGTPAEQAPQQEQPK
jgi:preprotein translocase subunit SecG